jgi:hypothetical protein
MLYILAGPKEDGLKKVCGPERSYWRNLFLRADADMVRFAADEVVLAVTSTGFIRIPTLAYPAF